MAKDKDTWVNREFDKYILGEESPSQEPTSEQPAGSPGIGNEYLDKVAQGIVKMEGLLNRMEKLEAFVNHQEEQEKEGIDSYGQYLAAMKNVADEYNKSAEAFREALNLAKEDFNELLGKWENGFDMSESTKDYMNRLPEHWRAAVQSAADSVINASNSFKADVRKFRWWVGGSIVWGVIATLFGLTAISRCSKAERAEEDARTKYEAVEPHMRHMENDQKKLIRFQKDNQKTWDKWWEQHQKEYTE